MRHLLSTTRVALLRLLAPALACTSAFAILPQEPPAQRPPAQRPPAQKPPAQDDADRHARELLDQAFRSLEEELKAAIQAYLAELQEAKSKGLPQERMPVNPAPTFYERFESLALQDQPDALRWCIGFVGSAGFPMDEAIARKTVLYQHMVGAHAGSRWIQDIVQFLGNEGGPTGIGIEKAVGFLDAIARTNPAAEVKAKALWTKGMLFERSDKPEHAGRALKTWREIVACCAATPEGRRAAGFVFQADRLQVGMTAPEVETEDVDGVKFKLSDYRGKVTVLVFWGFWSAPSRPILVHGKDMVARLASKPFALVGVNTDDDKERFKRLAQDAGVTWRQSWQGGRQGPWPQTWGILEYPTTFVLDEDGVIRGVGLQSQSLDALVDHLIAKLEAKQRGETPPK